MRALIPSLLLAGAAAFGYFPAGDSTDPSQPTQIDCGHSYSGYGTFYPHYYYMDSSHAGHEMTISTCGTEFDDMIQIYSDSHVFDSLADGTLLQENYEPYTYYGNCASCIGFGDDECDAVGGGDGAQSQVTFTPEDETYFSWTNCCEGLFAGTPTGVNFYISVECS